MRKVLFLLWCSALPIFTFAQEIQWASKVIEFSSELTPIQYSAEQVLGKPNVLPAAGESPSAWTPDRPNRAEFLKVGFANPMQIRQIVIAESYAPTTIASVFTYDADGKEYLMGNYVARSIPLKGRLFSLIFNLTPYKVSSVKIVIDGTAVNDYYSIDAIGISASAIPMDVEIEIMQNLRDNLLAERLSNNVNSPYKEYKPLLSPDGKTLFFSRKNHPENMGGVKDDEDIWYSEMDSTGEWAVAKNVGPPLNNAKPNFVSGITPDGHTVVLLLGNRYEKNGKKMRSGVSISSKDGDKWTKPYNLEIKNDYNYNERANYFLTNNRLVLILSVEREDSHGDRDLYVSFFEEDSTWTEPKNIGNVLNSAGDDASPFLAADNQTLYFSSNGRGGYGGFDVYVSKRLDDTWLNWSEPENLGSDINNSKDDLFFNIPLTGNYAYYSRSIGDDDADIFRVELPLRIMPSDVVIVRGKLINQETGEPIEAKIIYEKLPEGLTVGITKSNKETGEYEIVLPKGELYGFRAEAEGYLPVNENIDLRDSDSDITEVARDLKLVPVRVRATITMNNIFFDFDKASLKNESFPELNRLSDFLKENKDIKIDISGHADNTGPESYNMGLSKRRATAVFNYLSKRGIDGSRMKVEWFGEIKPAESNATKEGRSKNRRVEFTIVEK